MVSIGSDTVWYYLTWCIVFQNAFPVSGLYTTHLLSLDALLAVIDSVEQHCHHRVLHSTTKMTDSSPTQQEPPPPRLAADTGEFVYTLKVILHLPGTLLLVKNCITLFSMLDYAVRCSDCISSCHIPSLKIYHLTFNTCKLDYLKTLVSISGNLFSFILYKIHTLNKMFILVTFFEQLTVPQPNWYMYLDVW